MHDLLIFGATRNSGWLLAGAARRHGLSVAAMVRPGSPAEALRELGVTVLAGDAFSEADCCAAIEAARPRWLASTLGGKSADGRRIDAAGNLNVIRAAEAVPGIERALLVTSFGCGELYPQLSPAARAALGDAIRAKNLAETRWQASPLAWTLVRPGGLSHAAATGSWCWHDGADGSGGYLARADLAAALLDLLLTGEGVRQVRCISAA